jgi:hypothetical protein
MVDRSWIRAKAAIGVVAPGTMALILATAEPASAEGTCPYPGPKTYGDAGYYYSFQNLAPNWKGLEGYITVHSPITITNPANSHFLNYLSLNNTANDCFDQNRSYAQSGCWLQVGYGTGSLESPCGETNPLGIFAYEENVSVHSPNNNDYNCNWEYSISLSSDEFFTIFYTGQVNSYGDGLLAAYMSTSGGMQLIGNAWVPGAAAGLTSTVATEAYVGQTEQCPSEDTYQFFGDSATGGSSSTYGLYKSPDGASWDLWTTAPSNAAGYTGYYDYHSQASYYSFKTWDPNG